MSTANNLSFADGNNCSFRFLTVNFYYSTLELRTFNEFSCENLINAAEFFLYAAAANVKKKTEKNILENLSEIWFLAKRREQKLVETRGGNTNERLIEWNYMQLKFYGFWMWWAAAGNASRWWSSSWGFWSAICGECEGRSTWESRWGWVEKVEKLLPIETSSS
jgi:hypothetical protein